MVNLIRRFQQPLMILVTLVVIISFVWFYNSNRLDKVGADRVGVIYGRNYTQAEFARESRKYELCQYLLFELWQGLIQPATTADEAVSNYVWNTAVLRHEADRLGIVPTDAEIEAAIKLLPAFLTSGQYDSSKYNLFVQNALTPRGLMPDALEELVANDLRLQKIKGLLGATIAPAPAEIRAEFERRHRKLQCSVVRFDYAEFLKAQQPTDEEVKKIFEERKATLKTEELRKVKYVAFTLPGGDKPLAGKERVDALAKLSTDAQNFAVAMTEKKASIEDAAAKAGVKVVESPAFSMEEPPAEFGQAPEVAEAAFKLTKDEPNSDPARSDKGYFVLQLAEIIPARPKTFEEAKAKLLEDVKNERAQEAMNLKTTEIHNKLEADLKAGKSFADAATAAGVKPEPFPAFSMSEPPMKEPNGREVMMAANELNEGQLSSVVPTGNGMAPGGALLVYMAKKEPVDETKFGQEKGPLADQIARSEREAIFRQWFKLRRADAKVQMARGVRS